MQTSLENVNGFFIVISTHAGILGAYNQWIAVEAGEKNPPYGLSVGGCKT